MQRRSSATQELVRDLSPRELDPHVNRTLEKGQLGLELFNTSTKPLSVFLHSATTTIEGNLPPRSQFPKGPFTVVPGQRLRLVDDAIEMDKHPCGSLLGEIDMVVKYGALGRERFELRMVAKIRIIMESYGFVSQLSVDLTNTIS